MAAVIAFLFVFFVVPMVPGLVLWLLGSLRPAAGSAAKGFDKVFRPRKHRVDRWNAVMEEAKRLEAIKRPTPEEHRRRFACYAKLDEIKKEA